MSSTNLKSLSQDIDKNQRYKKRLSQVNFDTKNIEETVSEVEKNIFDNKEKSIVIYGEPQCGKTEMMIALTAKLLDRGLKHIVHLVQDNVKLKDQNLERFEKSGISPAPQDYTELIRSYKDIKKNPFIVFCKKNSKDMENLIEHVSTLDDIVIIDDEADYATPNSKINKKEQSKINALVLKLIKEDKGIWIGVTATPGRLDLNNTLRNNSMKWVRLNPHSEYYGHDQFFPHDLRKNKNSIKYTLTYLNDHTGDEQRHIREALFRYMVTVAKRNLINKDNNKKEEFLSMIVHTSTDVIGHGKDFETVDKVFTDLTEESGKYDQYSKSLLETAEKSLDPLDDDKTKKAKLIYKYIIENIENYKPVIMNSKKDLKSPSFDAGLKPRTIFTIIFGGNIISRGLTFDNLISMYFARQGKRINQDTYIQRARMFGARKDIFSDFELTIPQEIYSDWWQCFYCHRMSLGTINKFTPATWISHRKNRTTAPSSEDKVNIIREGNEVGWKKFKLTDKILEIYEKCVESVNDIKMLDLLKREINDDEIINDIFYYDIKNNYFNKNLHFQNVRTLDPKKRKDKTIDYKNISRSRGGFVDIPNHRPEAEYLIGLMTNTENEGRFFIRTTLNRNYLKNIKNIKKFKISSQNL